MIVDAVSAFGALPLDVSSMPEVDAAVFTTNKCLEALPGVGFAIARIDRLLACGGQAGSWSFDLAQVYEHALGSGWGSFRFTPPAQILAALDVALDYLDAEGRADRLGRYMANMRVLYDGVRDLGLTPWLPAERQGPVIVNVHAPGDPAWDLQAFVDALKRRGFLISNFDTTPTPSFRVGCIGAISPADMACAVEAIDEALFEIGVTRRGAVCS
jgi:2-aminoethylphosphonate-pyruvate transaminase